MNKERVRGKPGGRTLLRESFEFSAAEAQWCGMITGVRIKGKVLM